MMVIPAGGKSCIAWTGYGIGRRIECKMVLIPENEDPDSYVHKEWC
jgi:hypothetical protein